VLPPDVRHGGVEFTAEGLSVRYGLGAIGGVGPAAISQIRANQPYFSFADFKARSGVDAGVLYALAKAGALDSLAPSRRGMVLAVEAERNGDDVRCVHKTAENTGPHGLPCSYDWAKEPVPPPRFSAKTGRELKVIIKPPPALCTRKCRRYTPPEALDMGSVPEYPAADLFRHESAIYGTWMSESAFSRLDDVSEGLREQARLVALMIQSAPPGRYPLAAVYGGHHTALTRAGNKMWWVTLVTEAVMFELAAFEPRLDSDVHVPALLRQLQVGDLVSAQITKNRYESPGKGMRTGWRLTDIWPAGGS
jgi:DNA polymerase III alpha subunit